MRRNGPFEIKCCTIILFLLLLIPSYCINHFELNNRWLKIIITFVLFGVDFVITRVFYIMCLNKTIEENVKI